MYLNPYIIFIYVSIYNLSIRDMINKKNKQIFLHIHQLISFFMFTNLQPPKYS